MMRGEPSSFELISRLLCFLFVVSAATARLPRDEYCSSSSCGEIQSIRYPFRLKDDPDGCGDPNHELICRGNKTILEVFSGTYHVTDISYGDARFFSVVDDNSANDKCITIARLASPRAATVGSSSNYMMPYACAMATRVNVVDVNLASGKCVVPSRSVSPSSLVSDYYKTPELCWFAFLNCSEKITDNYDYTLVPCLYGNMRQFEWKALLLPAPFSLRFRERQPQKVRMLTFSSNCKRVSCLCRRRARISGWMT